jgi:archaellum component FlaF (FlaF/FlaG flagellin family)
MNFLKYIKQLLLFLLTFLLGTQTTYAKTELILPQNQVSFSIEKSESFKSLEKVIQPNIGFLKEKSKFGKSNGSSTRVNCNFSKSYAEDLGNGVDDVGIYTTKIRWGILDVDARPFRKGYWGKRTVQNNPRVDAYELKINPNNESFYIEHPNGGFVQFENLSTNALQDGKMILQPNNSFYHVYDKPQFLRQKVLDEAIRQTEAAGAKKLTVEWLVSDQKALTQLTQFFSENNVNIVVKFLAE